MFSGETLLSPLVMCGPHGLRFNKPVELRLPHSASVNPESWSFALKSSDSPSGQFFFLLLLPGQDLLLLPVICAHFLKLIHALNHSLMTVLSNDHVLTDNS